MSQKNIPFFQASQKRILSVSRKSIDFMENRKKYSLCYFDLLRLFCESEKNICLALEKNMSSIKKNILLLYTVSIVLMDTLMTIG